MFFSAEPKVHQGKVGGLFYFSSLLSLIILAALLSRFLVEFSWTSKLVWQISILKYLGLVSLGFLVGVLLCGKISVFIHELKHSIVSSLAGNKAKGMNYGEQSGDFSYTFSASTAHMNAFISLAPYTFPIFSILALAVYFTFRNTNSLLASASLAVALGIDLVLNLKDAGIHQTDLTGIRGGYSLAFLYVICFNLCLIAIVSLLAMFGVASLLEFVLWVTENVLLVIRPEQADYFQG